MCVTHPGIAVTICPPLKVLNEFPAKFLAASLNAEFVYLLLFVYQLLCVSTFIVNCCVLLGNLPHQLLSMSQPRSLVSRVTARSLAASNCEQLELWYISWLHWTHHICGTRDIAWEGLTSVGLVVCAKCIWNWCFMLYGRLHMWPLFPIVCQRRENMKECMELMCILQMKDSWAIFYMIQYDTIEQFNVDSKAECDQLNLAHETKTNKCHMPI